MAIIAFCQRERFPSEFSALSSGKSEVQSSSSIFKLYHVLEGGVLHVGGRLNKAAIPENIRHLLILSKDDHISDLHLHHIHLQLCHGGRNHVLSTARRKYWITSGPSAVRRILSRCLICKLHRGKAGEQKMSDLPEERVVPDLPPFTNIGVDYFGPIDVQRGRSIVKCYGVLFSCMTSRAVHLVLAYSLDQDSCIKAIHLPKRTSYPLEIRQWHQLCGSRKRATGSCGLFKSQPRRKSLVKKGNQVEVQPSSWVTSRWSLGANDQNDQKNLVSCAPTAITG